MLAINEIGGARVRRTFTRTMPDGRLENLRSGHVLSAGDVLSIGENNRRALIDAGYIDVWPKSPIESVGTGTDGDRHIVHLGRGAYDVIQGKKLNTEPLDKEAAEELATRPD